MLGDSADSLLEQHFERCYTVRFIFFGCSIDVVTGYYQAQGDSVKQSSLRVMCIYFRSINGIRTVDQTFDRILETMNSFKFL